MTDASPLWPARLHHLQIDTEQPGPMAEFYTHAFGYGAHTLDDGRIWLSGNERRLLLAPGRSRTLAFSAYALETQRRVEQLRQHVEALGVAIEPSPTPLLADGAFALRDPDGRTLAFGLPADGGDRTGAHDALPGRLQHVVVATLDLAATARFYQQQLGFVLSDRVLRDDGSLTTLFYRSDPEHHSFAAFLSDSVRLDHHALEAPDWNAIRDWADHFSAGEVPIIWGPGRHGPGNNLFCMVADPDGNMVEVSAELEQMPRQMAARDWPHTERSLNLWGSAIMRA